MYVPPGSLQNLKPSGPKKKYSHTLHNPNIQNTKQRILKAAKDKRKVTEKANPLE
jgi:hypothetical protein